jgi:hypothetical protein
VQYTDLDALRAAFTTAIRAIVPDHPRHTDMLWAPVDSPGDVVTARIRNYCVQLGFASSEGQIWSDAAEWQVPMRVWTSYAALDEHDPQSLAFRDARQMWIAFSDMVDPVVPGLLSVTGYEGFEAQNEDPGEVWGSHNFTIKFLASDY